MIDLRATTINRIIIHKIKKSDTGFSSISAEVSNNVIPINNEIVDTFKKRISKACGNPSKSFKVEIGDDRKFLATVINIKNSEDNAFITHTQDSARSLAESQEGKNTNEGYLIIIDGTNSDSTHICIAIKASFDDALEPSETDGMIIIKRLTNILLSSNQKLFKIGIIQEKFNLETGIEHEAILFDDQINTGERPAQFFYSDYLGFKLDSNPKYKCKQLFNDVNSFIDNNIVDKGQRYETSNALRTYLKNEEENVSTLDFRDRHIPRELRDVFNDQIVRKYPNVFPKDTELVKSSLKIRTLRFGSDKVKLTAPLDTFKDHVQVVLTSQELDNLTITDLYTILKIKGKPL
jgi:nucleoid-associated protein YejK